MKHIQQERLPLLVLEDQEAVLSMLFAADIPSEPLAQYLDYLVKHGTSIQQVEMMSAIDLKLKSFASPPR